MMDYWHAIINVLNRICPCPNQSNASTETQKEKSSYILSKLNDALNLSKGKMSACFRSAHKSIEEEPLLSGEAKKAEMESEFIEKAFIDISLREYGPPRYGMSKSSWTLLILARRAVEETVFGILNLKLPRYAE
jgi:hypothetical protein